MREIWLIYCISETCRAAYRIEEKQQYNNIQHASKTCTVTRTPIRTRGQKSTCFKGGHVAHQMVFLKDV